MQAAIAEHGDCTEADMHRLGWSDGDIAQHGQAAAALVRRWQDQTEAAGRADRAAAHDLTPARARRASSQIGTARARLDFLVQKLIAAGGTGRRGPAAPRAIDALDEAIDLLTETRRDLTGQAWAPKAPAGRAAA